jgi:hypothetical protein
VRAASSRRGRDATAFRSERVGEGLVEQPVGAGAAGGLDQKAGRRPDREPAKLRWAKTPGGSGAHPLDPPGRPSVSRVRHDALMQNPVRDTSSISTKPKWVGDALGRVTHRGVRGAEPVCDRLRDSDLTGQQGSSRLPAGPSETAQRRAGRRHGRRWDGFAWVAPPLRSSPRPALRPPRQGGVWMSMLGRKSAGTDPAQTRPITAERRCEPLKAVMAAQSRCGAHGHWSETHRERFWCYPDQLLFELPAGPAPSHS